VDPDPDPYPDPHPETLVRDVDPQIRIYVKISWNRNTAWAGSGRSVH